MQGTLTYEARTRLTVVTRTQNLAKGLNYSWYSWASQYYAREASSTTQDTEIETMHIFDFLELKFCFLKPINTFWNITRAISFVPSSFTHITPLERSMSSMIQDKTIEPQPKSTDKSYDDLRMESYNSSTGCKILASFFTWILLAGFVVFPGTFASLREATASDTGLTDKIIRTAIPNVKLLTLAVFCCVAGIAGMCFLWKMKFRNYDWLASHLFQ